MRDAPLEKTKTWAPKCPHSGMAGERPARTGRGGWWRHPHPCPASHSVLLLSSTRALAWPGEAQRLCTLSVLSARGSHYCHWVETMATEGAHLNLLSWGCPSSSHRWWRAAHALTCCALHLGNTFAPLCNRDDASFPIPISVTLELFQRNGEVIQVFQEVVI